MKVFRRRPLAQPEQDWAERTVRDLRLPRTGRVEVLLEFVAQRIGREMIVVPIDAPVITGALDDWPGGALAVRIPLRAGQHREHLICRGIARALYGHASPPDGRLPDYAQAIEREIEYAAMALVQHLHRSCRYARCDPAEKSEGVPGGGNIDFRDGRRRAQP